MSVLSSSIAKSSSSAGIVAMSQDAVSDESLLCLLVAALAKGRQTEEGM